MRPRGEVSASSLARAAFFRVLELTGDGGRRRRRLSETNSLVVLNLHRVSPEPSPYWPPLHPDRFEELLRFLRAQCHLTTFGSLADDAPAGRPRVILSFDDGYRDFLEYAMPVLDRFGVRANQNVVPSSVLSGRPPWSVRLSDFLTSAPRSAVASLRVGGVSLAAPPDTGHGRARFGVAVINRIKALSREERVAWWDEHRSVIDSVDVRETPMMTVDEVRAAATVHEIGVHSFSHESMGAESDEFFEHDFLQCRRFFDEQLHLPLHIYAFPNDSYRRAQVDALLGWGVRHVLLVEERASSPDRQVHPRFTFFGSTLPEIRLRSLGWTRRRAFP